MDDVIGRSLQGCASEEEERLLQAWRSERAENEEKYQRIAAIWRATRSYKPRIRTRSPDTQVIIAEAMRRRQGIRRNPRRIGRVAMIAASLVLGIVGGRWWTGAASPPYSGDASEVVTGVGETATARLPDGTVVRLAPESRLVFEPQSEKREVRLSGRAFFSVSSDPSRPFLVRTAAGETRVLGTRFELSARDQDLRIVVLEGRVAVSAGGNEVELGSRQVGHVREGAEASVVEVDDVWALLPWLGAFVAFESTPLDEVAQELEQRFGLRLEIEDEDLARQTVTVWFGDEPLDQVIGVLCQLVEATCTVENSVVRMRNRP